MFRNCNIATKKPKSCEDSFGEMAVKPDNSRGDKIPKNSQAILRKRKPSDQLLLKGDFQLSPANKDGGGSHHHISGSDFAVHLESTVDCTQTVQCHFVPEYPDPIQKFNCANSDCEADKCSNIEATESLQRDDCLEQSTKELNNNCKPDKSSSITETALSLKEGCAQTTGSALNNQGSLDCYAGSPFNKSKWDTGTKLYPKASHYQDHTETNSAKGSAVLDTPHKHREANEQYNKETTFVAPSKPQYYSKATYIVLIGDNVKVVNTKLYASLPVRDKYMVKERIPGTNKVKLVLKSSDENERYVKYHST